MRYWSVYSYWKKCASSFFCNGLTLAILMLSWKIVLSTTSLLSWLIMRTSGDVSSCLTSSKVLFQILLKTELLVCFIKQLLIHVSYYYFIITINDIPYINLYYYFQSSNSYRKFYLISWFIKFIFIVYWFLELSNDDNNVYFLKLHVMLSENT